MDTPWQFQMLGRLSARRGDRVVTRFASSRVAALLALSPGRAHPRADLIALLWPGDDSDAGRARLRVVLASLRRQLEPPDVPRGTVLVADRASVRLAPGAFHTDAAEFEAALKSAGRAPFPEAERAALDRVETLYAGELLPGFYDERVLEERERLDALHEDACARRQALPAAGAGRGPDPAPDERGFPLQFTRFFGREQEVSHVAGLLATADTRLVTLTGPGGAGKTRLADRAARRAASGFAGPVCFVALADLGEAGQIPDAILSALGLPRLAAPAPLDQVIAALTALPPALLVRDNFEHLVERGAPLVLSLLTRLPGLTCLVTSRRRLGLPGEHEVPVLPLPLPDPGGTAAETARAASAQLFVDRAQAARPDFQLTPGNAAAVAALCRTLEGIPLAIELVAARAAALTPAQMAERLAQRFPLLTSRRGDKGTRHRSLWAALEWSHDLLPADLARFFAALSVFRGGGTAESAALVCDQPQALEFLSRLRERSLVTIEDASEGGEETRRFRLLETLREFGEEHLPPEERAEVARRHASCFLSQAEEASPHLIGPTQARWLDRLEADHENLRRALAWWLAQNAVGEALRMCGALWRFWAVRGHYASGREWTRRSLTLPGGPDAARALALNGAGNLASEQAGYPAAESWYSESLALMRAGGDRAAIAACLSNLGRVAMHRADYAQAETLHAEALALRRADNHQGGIAYTQECQAVVAQHQRLFPRARLLHEEALAIWAEMGNDGGLMWALGNLAAISIEEGDDAQAARQYAECLALCQRLQDKHSLYSLIASFAALAARRGDLVRAATLAGASLSQRRSAGLGIHANDAADFEAALLPVRAGLSAAEFAAAWASGEALTADEAVACALEYGAGGP